MKNNFYVNRPFINIYEKPVQNSKISSQILFGECFQILRQGRDFYKIKTEYDKYIGFVKINSFLKNYKANFKVKVLKARIYKRPNLSSKSNIFLPFSSNIEILERNKNFFKFQSGMWIRKTDICRANAKTKNFNHIFKMFRNCKYKWGGKTYKGVDCSALIQLFYKFNNRYFPRDTTHQINYKRGIKNKKMFKSGDIIYWKGHVAVCLDSKNLIHAYGPRKKVVIMPINKTINLIEHTANLKVKKVFTI